MSGKGATGAFLLDVRHLAVRGNLPIFSRHAPAGERRETKKAN
jgi:hypothetical protein